MKAAIEKEIAYLKMLIEDVKKHSIKEMPSKDIVLNKYNTELGKLQQLNK
ncbi:hypothetical protein [Flammeovirga agarivorans]|uniref:Uncharacterized protein n=1 Tax=Flammeovirga agarivorans TaxID=2726742 RepID=A0A7X8XZ84_9BACT|nr:hypothetical protein [Flammeovirga agarivorans]NLR94924.1 hypothetical protein [Flammeovirga agarivorans]